MSSTDSARTTPPSDPIDPHERFSGRMEEYVGDQIDRCDRCGSDKLDGWITEGALGLFTVCARCGSERKEESR